ncbi:MAG: SUMF1/EgtB/PvdO family nonheme iron enzyme [Spirochaetota bacterium]
MKLHMNRPYSALLCGIVLFLNCGDAIKSAQDFSANSAPVISSFSVVNTGTTVTPYSSYPVTVIAHDPDGQALSYDFSSASGGFSNKQITQSGCTANFIPGDLAGGQAVRVAVTVSDGHGGYASSSVDAGSAKQGPSISALASRTHIRSDGSLTLSLAANCPGVAQLWPDSAAEPAGIDRTDSSKPMRIYSKGTLDLTIGGPVLPASADLLLPAKSPYTDTTLCSLWIVFRDGLGLFSAVKIPIYLDDQAPTLTWNSPASTTGVSLSPPVSVTFSEEIDASALPSALSIASGSGAEPVSFSSYDGNTRTARYAVSGLSNYTLCTAKISGVKDLAGNSLADNYLAFTTVEGASSAAVTKSAVVSLPYGGTKYTLPTGTAFTIMNATPDAILSEGISFPTGTDDSGAGMISKSFEMAETHVTYELWCIVRDWARENGYSFANGGARGLNNPAGSTLQPVSTVSWRDVIVWCNALTEYYNAHNGAGLDLSVVYCSDSEFKSPIRTTSNTLTISTVSGSEDNPYINDAAKGFRLPTLFEYEYAARYIGETPPATAAVTSFYNDATFYWTPGTYASGATGPISTDIPEPTNEVAWTSLNSRSSDNPAKHTHPVKMLKPNSLNLYDMSGNVYEWCQDKNLSTNKRGVSGSSCEAVSIYSVSWNGYMEPFIHPEYYGFRVARSK